MLDHCGFQAPQIPGADLLQRGRELDSQQF